MPLSIINCLCSISLDSNYQKYSMGYNLIGILSYIGLKFPISLKFTNIVDTLSSSCLYENRVSVFQVDLSLIEYTISVLLYIFEDPNLRSSIYERRLFEVNTNFFSIYQNILTPFTDPYFIGYKDDTADFFVDPNHKFCNLPLIILRIMLRSWTENGFKSLIKVLPYSSSSTQILMGYEKIVGCQKVTVQ
ncbi:hypothetical protein MXB_4595 [Myxobolus squamalis]|nr:hypothetical protein MXB_4595 [Myxobolus squamalis]